MKIAVCDDNKTDLLQMVTLLETYRHSRKADFIYTSFISAIELLASMERVDYDLILLDVLMPGINGIQAAREIREAEKHAEIVFLTSSPEFALDSYSVRAYYYILKPATKEKLFPVLDRLMDNFKKPVDTLLIKTQSSVLRIPYIKIEYIEVSLKKLFFYLTDGSKREVNGSLADYEQVLLRRPEFMKVHRSYLVNFQWVLELRQGELITAIGRRVPVARSAYPQLRTAYTQFLFSESEDFMSGGKIE